MYSFIHICMPVLSSWIWFIEMILLLFFLIKDVYESSAGYWCLNYSISGKPKVFLIQAYHRHAMSETIGITEDLEIQIPISKSEAFSRNDADIIIAYATTPGKLWLIGI